MIWSRSQAVYALLIRQPIVRFFASHFSYGRWPGRYDSRISLKYLSSIIRNLEAMSDQVPKESPPLTLPFPPRKRREREMRSSTISPLALFTGERGGG